MSDASPEIRAKRLPVGETERFFRVARHRFSISPIVSSEALPPNLRSTLSIDCPSASYPGTGSGLTKGPAGGNEPSGKPHGCSPRRSLFAASRKLLTKAS